MSAKVIVSAALSHGYDRRYVVVDEATGEVLDDAQGYGYKNAQNAHRTHAYKSMSPKKKRQRESAKRRVQRWCGQHPEIRAAFRPGGVLRDEGRPARNCGPCAGDPGRTRPGSAVSGR